MAPSQAAGVTCDTLLVTEAGPGYYSQKPFQGFGFQRESNPRQIDYESIALPN